MDDFELAAEMAAPGWDDHSLDSTRRRLAARGDGLPDAALAREQMRELPPDGSEASQLAHESGSEEQAAS